eukprot:1188555-Prorocentrum_minimum.AAC.5
MLTFARPPGVFQVRFAPSQEGIVRDVLDGAVDVGLVRADVYEGLVAQGDIPEGAVRVLEDKQSEKLAAPEWSLAALPWLHSNVSQAVCRERMRCLIGFNTDTF